jgi:dephospho-CoA kinase
LVDKVLGAVGTVPNIRFESSAMLVIGLTGGIASGKSFVANCFAELGAQVLDADEIAHEVLEIPQVVERIRSLWPEVISDDGQVDRKRLADEVFDHSDRRPLRTLEKLTHPIIRARIEKRLDDLQTQQTLAVVLDVPLLIKAGWRDICDKVVFVDVSERIRSQRATSNRSWSPEELEKREIFQTSLREKRQQATDILDNSQSKAETRKQVEELWRAWGMADKKIARF